MAGHSITWIFWWRKKVHDSTCNVRSGIIMVSAWPPTKGKRAKCCLRTSSQYRCPFKLPPIIASGIHPCAEMLPISWHRSHRSDVVGRRSHPGSFPQYDDRPFVGHRSHQDGNAIHRVSLHLWWFCDHCSRTVLIPKRDAGLTVTAVTASYYISMISCQKGPICHA